MRGVLPDHMISQMIEKGEISAALPFAPEQVQPASLDLRLGTRAYRVRASFLAGNARTVDARLSDFVMHEIDLSGGAVLEKGCVYLVPLMEALHLPATISGAASAKSSIGRLDLLTRIITDHGTEFDQIAPGYQGPLFAEICPRSFSVVVEPGLALTQIIFRSGQTLISDEELRDIHAKTPIVNGTPHIRGGLGFSVDLAPEHGTLVGYRAKPHTGIVDLRKLNHYDPREFWEEVHTDAQHIILDPGAFYILVSREAIAIPPDCAAEMAPYLAMVGEFRVHYAGFFDPGFGYSRAGGSGSRGVLEVRCHEAPFVLEHGQVVGRLAYEHMAATPKRLYGKDIKSNYQGQGLKLSKHFKS